MASCDSCVDFPQIWWVPPQHHKVVLSCSKNQVLLCQAPKDISVYDFSCSDVLTCWSLSRHHIFFRLEKYVVLGQVPTDSKVDDFLCSPSCQCESFPTFDFPFWMWGKAPTTDRSLPSQQQLLLRCASEGTQRPCFVVSLSPQTFEAAWWETTTFHKWHRFCRRRSRVSENPSHPMFGSLGKCQQVFDASRVTLEILFLEK